MRTRAVTLITAAFLLAACDSGSTPTSAPAPKAAADFPPPCKGSGSNTTIDYAGPRGPATGTSEADARRLMARHLKGRGSKRSIADARIIGRAAVGQGNKSLAFFFDEGGGSWHLWTLNAVNGSWLVTTEVSCSVVPGDSYLKGTWNVKALAGSTKQTSPVPDSLFDKVQVTFSSGRLTAFDGCDDLSGNYRYLQANGGLTIPVLGSSGRAVCDDQDLPPLASSLKAVRHVVGRGETRTLLDGNRDPVIELVRR